MVRSKKQQESEQPPNLIMQKDVADQRLGQQISKGEELKQVRISSKRELEEEKKEYKLWDEFNYELLLRMFDNKDIAEEYKNCNFNPITVIGAWDCGPTLTEEIKDFMNDINEKLAKLTSIKARLELIPVVSPLSNGIGENSKTLATTELAQKIFVVYGHDITAKTDIYFSQQTRT